MEPLVCTKRRLLGVWVRVSGGHLCEAEALTEAAAETVACVSYDGGVVTNLKYLFVNCIENRCRDYLILIFNP